MQNGEEHIYWFVGENVPYYQRQWSKYDLTSRAQSWNWAAFCFSLLWLAYRRMYTYCYIFSFLMCLLVFFGLVFDVDRETMLMLVLTIPTLLGLFGNRMYYYFAKQQSFALYELRPNDNDLRQILYVRGGTSILSALLALIALSVIGYLLLLWLNLIPPEFTIINVLKILAP